MSRDDRKDVRIRTSKALAYILRHGGPVVGLQFDPEGFATLDDVMKALRILGRIHNDLTLEQLTMTIDDPANPRFERHGERVRARYGHVAVPDAAQVRSAPERVPLPAPAAVRETPPPVLYHGTNQHAAESILAGSGLLSRGRQYVHLSVNPEEATRVDSRHGPGLAILRIDAAAAHSAGIVFTHAGERTWLAAAVPVEFIHREEAPPSIPRERPAAVSAPTQRRRPVAIRPGHVTAPASAPTHRPSVTNQGTPAIAKEPRPGAPRRRRGR